MNSSLRRLAGSMLVAACVAHSSSRLASSRPCAAPSAAALIEVADLKTILADPDSARVAYRDSLGIGGVAPRSVVEVTDPVICTAVTNAVSAYMRQARPPAQNLYVLRVGPRYLAIDPAGEDASQWFLTRDFVVRHYLVP